MTEDEVLNSITDNYTILEFSHNSLYLLITQTPAGWDGFVSCDQWPTIIIEDRPSMLECLDELICRMAGLVDDARAVREKLEQAFTLEFRRKQK